MEITQEPKTKLISAINYVGRMDVEIDYITIVGLVAAAFTVTSLVPQILKVLKTKSTKDISLGTYSFLSSGVLLWFFYGIFMRDVPIIIANSLSFVGSLSILILKVKYG